MAVCYFQFHWKFSLNGKVWWYYVIDTYIYGSLNNFIYCIYPNIYRISSPVLGSPSCAVDWIPAFSVLSWYLFSTKLLPDSPRLSVTSTPHWNSILIEICYFQKMYLKCRFQKFRHFGQSSLYVQDGDSGVLDRWRNKIALWISMPCVYFFIKHAAYTANLKQITFWLRFVLL